MRHIPPHQLWIGNRGDLRGPASLRAAGIRALIDLALDEPPHDPGRELVYCRFPLTDGRGNPPAVLHAAIVTLAGLIRSNTPTLVVCSAGMSRAPCIAAAAVCLTSARSPAECLSDVIRNGPADISGGLWESVLSALTTPV